MRVIAFIQGRFTFLLVAFLFAFPFGRARAQEAGPWYFAELYGLQNWRNAAAFSHSFASFYEVDTHYNVTRIDISWIPQDQYLGGLRDLRMPAFGDWPGQNMPLEKTLSRAAAARRTVGYFGPYAANPELFRRELEQVARFNSGRVLYRGLDMATRPFSVNCVHAITSPIGEFLTGAFLRGPTASEAIARFFYDGGYLQSLDPRRDWYAILHGAYAKQRRFTIIH